MDDGIEVIRPSIKLWMVVGLFRDVISHSWEAIMSKLGRFSVDFVLFLGSCVGLCWDYIN